VFDVVQQWLHHSRAVGWTAAIAVGTFLLSFAAGLGVVVALPADYFVRGPRQSGFWHSHSALRLTLLIVKNLVGGLLLLLGLVMAMPLVPGPGLLLILVGLGLLDFPGKRALERRLLRRPWVLASVNKMRARYGKPPMIVDGGPNHDAKRAGP
jgi:hypothetical protein